MVRHRREAVEYSILLLRRFPLRLPRKLQEAEKFNIQYPDPKAILHTADKLRWYRHNQALLQRQVADFAGIDRGTYIHYEDALRDYYPVDKLEKIAQVLEVEVTDLMDDYNLFLYRGQGQQIRAKRESLGLSISQYAKAIGIRSEMLTRWENDRARISKTAWERYFQ